MELIVVLKESLKLLKKEPKVFVPRIFTMILFSFFVLYSASISLKFSRAINAEMEISKTSGTAPDIVGALAPFTGDLLFFGALFLLVYVVDILTYGMYVSIASDFHKKKQISLLRALKDAVSGAKTLFLIGIAATVFVGFFIVVYLIIGNYYISTQNPLYLLGALLVMLLAIVAFALVFFFAVPIAMMERQGMISTVKKSASVGMAHKGLVIKVNFLFVGLVFVSMVVVMLTEFQGYIALGAIILFVIARLFQAMVYTYISIVNPTLYLSLGEANDKSL